MPVREVGADKNRGSAPEQTWALHLGLEDESNAVTMALTATRASRKPFTVKPLPAEAAAEPDTSAKPKMTPEQWANAKVKELREIKTDDEFAEWVNANGKALQKLKSSDASTWETLNEIVGETRSRVVGETP